MPVGPYGALLDAVRGVRWPARRPVTAGAPGAHQARSRGAAPEFAEYRPYRQGDDPKRLDWKLLARSDRAFIRLAPDHAVLGTTLLLDASASMAFPGVEAGKWAIAKRVAVGLAAVAHGSGDPVGLTVVGGGREQRFEPRARRGVVGDLARALDATVPGGWAELAPRVATCALRVVAITDCLGDWDELRRALARHVVRGGEAYLVHAVARAELAPAREAMLAEDPEDASLRRPLLVGTYDDYGRRFAAFRLDVSRECAAAGIEYHELVDDAAADRVVRRVVRPSMRPAMPEPRR